MGHFPKRATPEAFPRCDGIWSVRSTLSAKGADHNDWKWDFLMAWENILNGFGGRSFTGTYEIKVILVNKLMILLWLGVNGCGIRNGKVECNMRWSRVQGFTYPHGMIWIVVGGKLWQNAHAN